MLDSKDIEKVIRLHARIKAVEDDLSQVSEMLVTLRHTGVPAQLRTISSITGEWVEVDVNDVLSIPLLNTIEAELKEKKIKLEQEMAEI